jgi:hypothetical protein
MPRKKSPVTGPGIDPGTFWLVAQYLNHYATPGPNIPTWKYKCVILEQSEFIKYKSNLDLKRQLKFRRKKKKFYTLRSLQRDTEK